MTPRIRKNYIYTIFTCLILLILLLVPIPSSGEMVWTEDFESDKALDNWRLRAYGNYSDNEYLINEIEPQVTIDDAGMLLFENEGMDSQNYIMLAEHESTTAVGTWSWDVDVQGSFSVSFMYGEDGDYNWTGIANSTLIDRTGYELTVLQSYVWTVSIVKHPILFPSIENVQLQDQDFAGPHHFDLTRDQKGEIEVYIDDETESVLTVVDTDYQQSSYFYLGCFQTYAPGGTCRFDNIEIRDTVEPPQESFIGGLLTPTVLIISGVFVTIVAGILVYQYQKKTRVKSTPSRSSKDWAPIKKIAKNFDLSTSQMYFLLLGKKYHEDDEYIKEISRNMPQDLRKFKYLLHPTRLLIMKVLHGEYMMSAANIKKTINITSGNYSSHSRSLESKGYIEINSQFDENGEKQLMVQLTELGRKEYETLVDLLQEFLDRKTPMDFILNSELEKEETLYPRNR